jgi:hypothetical protein
MRLGIGSVQGHIGCMETFDKCMSVLRPLISEGDTNGIGAAERAVNEYVAAPPESERQTALANVRKAVEDHKDDCSGIDLSFADTVNDYIERLMKSFE